MAEQVKTTASDKATKQHKPYHEQVAERLIEQLKQGTPPWRKPWKLNYDPRPANPSSGKPYRGINSVFLTMSGYADPRWMTYNQAKDLGYTVRKGEHGSPVQYWKWHENVQRLDDEGKPLIGADGKPVTVRRELERPKVFYSTVFNATQMDGVPPLPEHPLEWDSLERAEQLIQQSGVPVNNDGLDRAYYRTSDDTIHLPERGAFRDESDYYGTALHELGHSTGHESRLNRDLMGAFGSESYAREELVAEISSMMIGQELRLDPRQDDNTAAYVGNWIKLLSDHPLELLRAASAAEKAKEYIMQREQEQEQGHEEEITPGTDHAPQMALPDQSKREYVLIPYKEKEEAKSLGAKWDGSYGKRGSWYIPESVDVAPFQKWINQHNEWKAQQAQKPQEAEQPAKQTAEIVRLSVPYKEKDEAKALGARYSSDDKCWYALSTNPDLGKLQERWSFAAQENKTLQEPGLTPHEEFAQFLETMGMEVSSEHPVFDGVPHRIPVKGDKQGELSGFYVVHADGRPAGYAQNHKTGQKTNWKATGYVLSEEQKTAMQAQAMEKLQTRSRDLAERQELVARACAAKLEKLPELMNGAMTTMPPYLLKKGLDGSHKGTYLDGEKLVVPAYNVKGEVRTLQTISVDGQKSFTKGGEKSGNFHVVGGLAALTDTPVLILCEGYATAATIAEATGLPVVAAFDSGNLNAVAKALHEAMPEKGILIAGDDDRGKRINVGRSKAEAAAQEVGGRAVFPVFGRDDKGTDFNDMMVLYDSKKVVSDVLAPAIEEARNQTPLRQATSEQKQVRQKERGRGTVPLTMDMV